jgi:hypothetical protein
MGSEKEIYRTANLLIEEYGEMAAPAAFIRADQLLERGDMPGRRVWLRIAKVTEDLMTGRVPGGASIH